MTDKALATITPGLGRIAEIPKGDLDFIRKVYAPGVSPRDFERFVGEAEHRGLDPVLKEIYAIPGFGTNRETGEPNPAIIMPSINGYRKLADVTGLVDGTVGPQFCGPDADWKDFWDSDTPPSAARFMIYRKDRALPTVAVVTWKARARRYANGSLQSTWAKMPVEMLGINAERAAWQRCGLIHNGVRETPAGLDPHDIAQKRAHAAAAEQGIDHDALRAVVQTFNPEVETLAEASAEDLHAAADYIDAVGVEAVPEAKASPEVKQAQNERQAFITELRKVLATGFTKKKLTEFLERAKSMPDGFNLLIEAAPTEPLARLIAQEAEKAGIRKEAVDASVNAQRLANEAKVAAAAAGAERPEPPADAGDDTQIIHQTIDSWVEFWQLLEARGIDKGAFEALVAKKASAFATPDLAMMALNEAEADMIPVPEGEEDVVEGEFDDVDLAEE